MKVDRNLEMWKGKVKSKSKIRLNNNKINKKNTKIY